VVRFKGPAQQMGVGTYIGVELADAKGNCNGTLKGTTYFQCEDDKGVLCPIEQVKTRISGEVKCCFYLYPTCLQ
jgi:dynactin complex subunit